MHLQRTAETDLGATREAAGPDPGAVVMLLGLSFQINVIQPIYSSLSPFYAMHVIPLKDKNENNKLAMYQNCNIKMKHIQIFNKF